MRRHKVKQERPGGSSGVEKHDLSYCIHDRVELLHQVFSLLGPKEIKAMAPGWVSDLSMDDLQELCLEELLGISSKRLLATMDGETPPSDTESSSEDSEARHESQNMEALSLDSISSDEEALSTGKGSQNKKKHKQCKRRDKRKHKTRLSSSDERSGERGDKRGRAAERVNTTVLEMLELQARAAAIRAQLKAEKKGKLATAPVTSTLALESDDDVTIKEEPPEVVELLSSDDETPSAPQLTPSAAQLTSSAAQLDPSAAKLTTTPQLHISPAAASSVSAGAATSEKQCGDLTIIIPKTAGNRKIKLNRQKSATVTSSSISPPTKRASCTRKKSKSTKSKRASDGHGSDQDEITLQLSDSEKMDLLEDFDRKAYDQVSSSSEDESEDSSDSSNAPGSPKRDAVAADGDRLVTRDNVDEVAVTLKNDDKHNTAALRNSDNSSVTHDNVDNSSVASDCQTRNHKVDTELKSEELPVKYGTGPRTNETCENGDEEKTDAADSEETVKIADENSAVILVEEGSHEVKETIRPDSAIESHASSMIAHEDKVETISMVETLSENDSIVIEEENKSNAINAVASNIQELSPPKVVEDSASEINTVANRIDTSDGETTKHSKAKKKNKKKEKKEKKKKKSKD